MHWDRQNQSVTFGLSNVVRYNGVFVIAGFVIVGCHCSRVMSSSESGSSMLSLGHTKRCDLPIVHLKKSTLNHHVPTH